MEMNKSTEALDTVGNDDKDIRKKNKSPKKRSVVLLGVLLCMFGIGAFVTITVLFLARDSESFCDQRHDKQNLRVRELYEKIQSKYHEVHPGPLLKNENGITSVQRLYMNFTPALYKLRTQTAKSLLKELISIETSITLRKDESLTFELYRRFLVNTFGVPAYENNYEIGDWLLGPNIYCWQKSCELLSLLHDALKQIKPKTVNDVELIVDFIKKCSEGYRQRIKNLKNGVLAGIVLPDVACRAGLENFKTVHVSVAKKGAYGIFDVKDIVKLLDAGALQGISEDEKVIWSKKYNVTMERYLKDSLVNYVGRSLNEFLRYLKDDYSTHCPPSNISSGFASLPLPYIYTNGVADLRQPTTGRLPGGEKFNGSSAYRLLLKHFTTYDITPEEVNNLADEKLNELYAQVVKIAKDRTKEADEFKAIVKFRSQLESDDFFYTIENENNYSEPYMRCYDDETAQKNCPERWKAMTQWLQSAEVKVNQLKKMVHSAFYVKGEKKILPVCNVTVAFDFTPVIPYHSYSEGDEKCSYLAKIFIPFFLKRPGPRYEEITVMAHEAYPGHHLEVQGVKEHVKTKCDQYRKWVSKKNYFAAFSEGWATYIEKDVADTDMKLYKNDMQRYGMLKHQILAALRAKVDVGVHYLGMKRQDAVSLYQKYALDTSDGIQKEITRLQSAPGQGTAYMVGEAKFSECRSKAKAKLGKEFNVRDFHYEVLRQGELPLLYMGKMIDDYIQNLKKQ